MIASNLSNSHHLYFTFSLGTPCADVYQNYDVKTSKVKSSNRIEMNEENRRKESGRFAESIMNNCSQLIRHVDSLLSMDKICKLRDEILFILDMLNQLAITCGTSPSRMYRNSYMYDSEVEMTRDRRIDDLGNIILDLHTVCERLKFFVRWTRQIDLLNEVIRILYAFHMYVSSIVECNPEFWPNKKKPHYVLKTKSPWWDRR